MWTAGRSARTKVQNSEEQRRKTCMKHASRQISSLVFRILDGYLLANVPLLLPRQAEDSVFHHLRQAVGKKSAGPTVLNFCLSGNYDTGVFALPTATSDKQKNVVEKELPESRTVRPLVVASVAPLSDPEIEPAQIRALPRAPASAEAPAWPSRTRKTRLRNFGNARIPLAPVLLILRVPASFWEPEAAAAAAAGERDS